jgi:hypothetical protein
VHRPEKSGWAFGHQLGKSRARVAASVQAGGVLEPLTADLLAGLDVALNESELHDVVVDVGRGEALVLVSVLTLPEEGPEPADRRRLLHLLGVTQVTASLRHGRWDDDSAPVEPFALDELSDMVRSFQGQPIYGWEFFDAPSAGWDRVRDRRSLQATLGTGTPAHTLDLFQESAAGPVRHFQLRLGFDELVAYDDERNQVPLAEMAAGGRRWWDAMYAHDPRTLGHGIVPAAPGPSGKSSSP